MKIAFFDARAYDEIYFEKQNQKKHEITYFKENLTEKNVNLAKNFDAVCCFVNTEGNSKILQKLKKLGVKHWFQRSMGYEKIDLREAKKLNFNVFRIFNYSAESISEHALSLLMHLNRNLFEAETRTKNCNFTLNNLEGKVIANSLIGVIGCGKIGQSFIKGAKGLQAKVIVFDQYAEKNFNKTSEKLGFEWVSKETLFQKADFISLHVPLLPSTKYIINQQSISLMKKGVTIINTSRGELINTSDLVKGLKENKIKSVGLDVIENEKDLFYFDKSLEKEQIKSDPNWKYLLESKNVIITSHQAFFTKLALSQIAKMTIENARNAEKGDFTKALLYQENGGILNG